MDIESLVKVHLDGTRELLKEARHSSFDRLMAVLGGGAISFGSATAALANAVGISPWASVVTICVGTLVAGWGYLSWSRRKQLELELYRFQHDLKKLEIDAKVELEKARLIAINTSHHK